MDTNMYIKKLTAGKIHESKNTLIKDDNGVQYNCYIKRPYNTLFKKYKSYDGNTFIENNDDTDEKQVFTLCNKDITPDEALEKVKKLIPNFTSNENYKIININNLKNYAKNAYIQSFTRVIEYPYDSESKLNEYLLEYFNQIIDDVTNFYERDDNKLDIGDGPDKEHGIDILTGDNMYNEVLDGKKPYANVKEMYDELFDYKKKNLNTLCEEYYINIDDIFSKKTLQDANLPNNAQPTDENVVILLRYMYRTILKKIIKMHELYMYTDCNVYINIYTNNKDKLDMITGKDFIDYLNDKFKSINLTDKQLHDLLKTYYINDDKESIEYIDKIDNLLLNIVSKYLDKKTVYDLYMVNPSIDTSNILKHIILFHIFDKLPDSNNIFTLYNDNEHNQSEKKLYDILNDAVPNEFKTNIYGLLHSLVVENNTWKNNIIKNILQKTYNDIYNIYGLTSGIDTTIIKCALYNVANIDNCVAHNLKKDNVNNNNIVKILKSTRVYDVMKHNVVETILPVVIVKFLSDRRITTVHELLTNNRYTVDNILTMLTTPAILAELKDEKDNITENNAYITILSFLLSLENNNPHIIDKKKKIMDKYIFNYDAETKHNITFHKCLQNNNISTITNLKAMKNNIIRLNKLLNCILGINPPSELSGGSSNRLSKLYISAKNDYYLL